MKKNLTRLFLITNCIFLFYSFAQGDYHSEDAKNAFIKGGGIDLGNNIIQFHGRKELLRKKADLDLPLIQVESRKFYDFEDIQYASFVDDEQIYLTFLSYDLRSAILNINNGQITGFKAMPGNEKPERTLMNDKAFVYLSALNQKRTNNAYLYVFTDKVKSGNNFIIPYKKLNLPARFASYLDSFAVSSVIIDEKRADLPQNDEYTFNLLHQDTGHIGKYNILYDTEIMLTKTESQKYLDGSVTYNLDGELCSSDNRSTIYGKSFGFKDTEEGIFVTDKEAHKEKKIFNYGYSGYICPDESTRLVLVENTKGSSYIIVLDEKGKNIKKIDCEIKFKSKLYCISQDRKNLVVTEDGKLEIIKLAEPLY